MEFNLSGPFMRIHKIDQLHSKGKLRIHGKLIPLISHPPSLSIASKNSSSSHTIRGNVYVLTTQEIPPQSVSFISTRIPCIESSSHLHSVAGLFESLPCQNLSLQPVSAALCEADSNGTLHVPILNLGDQPYTLSQDTRIGTFQTPKSNQDRIGSLKPGTKHQSEEDKMGAKKRKHAPLTKEKIVELFKLDDSPILVRNPHLKKQTIELLQKYSDTISVDDKYGKTHLVEHEIITEDVPPIKLRHRPINPVLEKNLRDQVTKWTEQGIVQPSTSPWSFPLVPVPKKNGKIRWAVDYRKLNSVTKKDSFPIPNVNDNLSRLSKSRIFSTIDGAGAFHAVPIRPEDREKTAFSTPFGLFEYLYMPFGLVNAPSTYSRLVQQVLHGIPSNEVIAYLDDACCHSWGYQDHLRILEKILQRYRQAGLTIQPDKTHLFQDQVVYLGHQVTSQGIGIVPAYVKVVRDWPEPKTPKEIQIFLGKTGYYRKFIPHYSALASPLSRHINKDELQKNEPFCLSAEEKSAFQELKAKLISAPILAFPDFESEEPFIVDTDWSKHPGNIGGVLSQKQEGKERVIAYGARKLLPREKNYSSNKGELLGVIHFLKTWKYYLQHRKFVLRTDHHALKWIRDMENPAGMVGRWQEILSHFDFDVVFRKGTQHRNADTLSRIDHAEDPTPQDLRESEQEAVAALQLQDEDQRIEPDKLVQAQNRDEDLSRVRDWVSHQLKPSVEQARQESPEIQAYLSEFELLELDSDGVLRKKKPNRNDSVICLPKSMQEKAVLICHRVGHQGRYNTRERVQQRFYFPDMTKIVEKMVTECVICQQKTQQRKDQKHTLASSPQGFPFQKVSLDFVGPLSESSRGNKYLLTVKDVFTRWIEAYPTSDMTAETVINCLERQFFSRYGIPLQLHSDNGTQFTSELMKEVCRVLRINKTETPTYNPKSNPVERSHRDLGLMLRAMTTKTAQDWEDVLPACLFALRTSRNFSTNITPFYALYGREAVLPVDIMFGKVPGEKKGAFRHANDLKERLQEAYNIIRTEQKKAIERNRRYYTDPRPGEEFDDNRLVWLFTPHTKPGSSKKLSVFWTGPWKIVNKVTEVLYRIKTAGNWNERELDVVVSLDRLKPYEGKTIPNEHPTFNLQTEDLELDDMHAEEVSQDQQPISRVTVSYGMPIDTIEDLADIRGPIGTSAPASGGPTASTSSPEQKEPSSKPERDNNTSSSTPSSPGTPPYSSTLIEPMPSGSQRSSSSSTSSSSDKTMKESEASIGPRRSLRKRVETAKMQEYRQSQQHRPRKEVYKKLRPSALDPIVNPEDDRERSILHRRPLTPPKLPFHKPHVVRKLEEKPSPVETSSESPATPPVELRKKKTQIPDDKKEPELKRSFRSWRPRPRSSSTSSSEPTRALRPRNPATKRHAVASGQSKKQKVSRVCPRKPEKRPGSTSFLNQTHRPQPARRRRGSSPALEDKTGDEEEETTTKSPDITDKEGQADIDAIVLGLAALLLL